MYGYMTIPELALMGFIIGLTGALAPGPTLVATIHSALRIGWTGGPRVTVGHIIAEMGIVLLIVAGVTTVSDTYRPVIAGIGGVALVIFGGMTLLGARNATLLSGNCEGKSAGPVLAGLITSISNPYFWIWWFSVGSALLFSSFSQGIAGLLAFIGGHWSADLAWFTLISVGIHRSKTVIDNRIYRGILLGCGLLLVIFGMWFLTQAL